MDKDVFDLQEIKRVEQSFYVLTILFFHLISEVAIYLFVVIINGNLLR